MVFLIIAAFATWAGSATWGSGQSSGILQAYPAGTVTPTPPPFTPEPQPTLIPSPTPTPTPPPETRIALDYIATREGIPVERLFPVNQHQREYGALGKTFWYVKALDRESHHIYTAMVDLSDQSPVELEDIERAQREALEAKYGKLEPQLYELLQTKAPDDEVNVAVWFTPIDLQALLAELSARYPQVSLEAAVHNIHGPSGIPTGEELRDGAGAIDAAVADTIAATGYSDVLQYPYPACESPCWWSNYVYNNYPGHPGNFPPGTYRWYYFEASAGERIRVALAWVSNPAGPGSNYWEDPLETDLDLAIFDPNWQVVENGYSASNDNSYELVDFVAPKTGEYKIGVYKKPSTTEYLNHIGIAWTKQATYLPDIKANYNGWTSELVIRNDGAASRDISTHFFDQNGDFVNGATCSNVLSGGTCSFSASIAVNNFSGSAIVDGSEDVSVVVKQRHNDKTYAYSGFPDSSVFGFTPGTPIYLPNSFYDYYGWYSHATVQNAGNNTATVLAEYSNSSGVIVWSEVNDIPPAASAEFDSPAGITTSAMKLTSTNGQPIVATATQYDTQSIEQSTRTSGYISFSMGGNDVYLPGLYKNYYGWASSFRVQNLGSSPATLTIKYYDQYGNNVYTEEPPTIASHGWREFYQGDDPGPSSFTRSAWVDSDQPIVAVANQETSSDHQSYSGFIGGARAIYLPLVQQNYDGWFTGIQVQNTSQNEVAVTIKFYHANGDFAGSTGPWAIDPYTSQVFYDEIPNGLNGSAVVTADGDVVVIVNQNNYGISDGALSYSGLD